MTFGTLAAVMARDAITEATNPWQKLFEIDRSVVSRGPCSLPDRERRLSLLSRSRSIRWREQALAAIRSAATVARSSPSTARWSPRTGTRKENSSRFHQPALILVVACSGTGRTARGNARATAPDSSRPGRSSRAPPSAL